MTYSENTLYVSYRGANDGPPILLDRLHSLTVFGEAGWQHSALAQLMARNIPVFFADASGYPTGTLFPESPANEFAQAIIALVKAATDGKRRLELARPLIAAKLRNYATLAETYPRTDGKTDQVASESRQAASKAEQATSLASLRGIEGAAAARWYSGFAYRLPYGFYFRNRVAPKASDPVNVLLNIAHTHLHNTCVLSIKSNGLTPSVGLLHDLRPGHAALASDLQEPFRHFMDRCVLEACRWLRPNDFQWADELESPYRLTFRPGAARLFSAFIAKQLAHEYRRKESANPKSVRAWIDTLTRNLRHVLQNPGQPFTPFEHDPAKRDLPENAS